VRGIRSLDERRELVGDGAPPDEEAELLVPGARRRIPVTDDDRYSVPSG